MLAAQRGVRIVEYDVDLNLADSEIASALSAAGADIYPPILSLGQAAALAQVPLGTIRDWRSRGLLSECSYRRGREVRVWRDRFIKFIFGSEQKRNGSTRKRKI